MATQWIARLYFFVPTSAVNATLRDTVANAFVNNNSGESLVNERKLVNGLVRLSTTGNEPAQALAINTVVKASMRDAIKTIIQSVNQSAWYVVSNRDGLTVQGQTYNESELIESGGLATADGQIGTVFTFADAVADLGLRQIEAQL